MEVEEIQTLSRRGVNSNGKIDSKRTVFCDEVAEGEIRRQRNKEDVDRGRVSARRGGVDGGGGGATLDFTAGVGGLGRVCGWPSSRIVRVSRASGGKDRHSKVLTSKGLRDRRVRLSVNTAIQFYDLQDRLGYDQPSKAVEWLIKAAADSITELPPISIFSDTLKQLSDEKMSSGEGKTRPLDSAHVETEGRGGDGLEPDNNTFHTQQGTLSKSACSSTSETSKGSGGGLSLSRSRSRLKARERARERAAKDKDKESEITFVAQHQNANSIPQNATFTELLTSGFTGTNINVVNQQSNNSSPNGSGGGVHESNFFQKSPRNWDYFGGTGLLAPSTTTRSTHVFPGQIQLGSNVQQALATHHVPSPFFTVSGDTNQELHSFSLIPEHFVPVVTTSTIGGNNNHNNEYNLNFSISNRGTLQSNSSPLLPQIQRFSSADNGSSPSPFFLGTAPPPNAAVENHHHQRHFLPTGFDAGLQLFYGDGNRHADYKGKGKR